MALTGSLVADFSSFQAACANAEVSLKGFETGAGKVETSLNRMANTLSGTKLIQDANLMVEAVDRIGGVSKLTERELAKLSAQAKEAAEKMTKMGQDVPPGLQRIADSTKTVDTAQSNLIGTLKGVAAAFGIAFSLSAIVRSVSQIIEFGGTMTDLAARTGISTSALQEFKFAGEQVGVSLDSVVNVVGQLQNRIAGGDKSALAALSDLGINFDALRAMQPEAQFQLIADKLGDVEDQAAFVALGMDLMGRGFLEVAPLIKADLDALIEKSHRLGVVLSDQTVKNLDEMGDSLTSLKAVGTAVMADFLQPMLPLLTTLANGAIGLASWISKAQVAFEQFLGMVAGAMATLSEWELRLLKLTNAFGVNNERIKMAADSAAYYRNVAHDLSTTQDVVTKAVVASTAAVVPFVFQSKEAAAATTAQATALKEKAAALDLVEPKLGSLAKFIKSAAKETEVWNSGLVFTSETIGTLVPELEVMAAVATKAATAAKTAVAAFVGMGSPSGTQANGDVIRSSVHAYGEGMTFFGGGGQDIYRPSGHPYGEGLRFGGGGVTVNNAINVNGTAEDVARQVANEVLRTVKQGSKLAA